MISILDCTLRDGGYINNFVFGERAIKDIIKKLGAASIDIIECGFLKRGEKDPNKSLFDGVESIGNAIGMKNHNSMYVGMIQLGKFDIEDLAAYDGSSIDGIRLSFHEYEIDEAFESGRRIMEKGYKLFMQPVGTTSYTDEALVNLINRINEMHPYAFYMVDTLGIMYKRDLLHMFNIVNSALDKNIVLGFHSHNNLQMSFANCQELLSIDTDRDIIVDASVLGMGRGAGNLNTELATQYININFGLKYDNFEVLAIVDEYIKPLSYEYKWGYDAAYYLAAILGCHPNYASYLMNMQTLQVQDINVILSGMEKAKRALFDKEYISAQYLKYMDRNIDDSDVRKKIEADINGRKVMILAPGKSLGDSTELINKRIKAEDYYVVSVNFFPKDISVDMVFISNLKRFANIGNLLALKNNGVEVVVTSNIKVDETETLDQVNYSSYINEDSIIMDNAGLMSMNLMKKLGVKELLLAGFDGFSNSQKDNYYDASLVINVAEDRAQNMNIVAAEKIAQLSTQMDIKFISESIYR